MFVEDFGSGAAHFGAGAGEAATAFAEHVNKKALVDAEVARSEAVTERMKMETMRQKLRDQKAADLARFNVEWEGPDAGYVKKNPGERPSFAGVDAAGRLSPLDHIRRRKMRAMQEIAANLPEEMLPQFFAIRTREMEEEIVQSQREAMQDQLADLAGRLARTPYGEVYQPEIESALEALDAPNSDPTKAEQVYTKIQGIVENAVVEQMAFEKAEATVGGLIESVAAEGGDVAPYAEVYGKLMSGQLTPEEARGEALRRKFNLGPDTWTVPGTSHKMEVRSQILRGRGRNIDELDAASANEAWLMGAAMAREDPSLGELATPDQVFELTERYAMHIIQSGGWTVPPGYAGKPWQAQHKRNDPANIARIRADIQAGRITDRKTLDAMLAALNIDPNMLSSQVPSAEGGGAEPQPKKPVFENKRLPAAAALEGGQGGGTPSTVAEIQAKQRAAGEQRARAAAEAEARSQAEAADKEILAATAKTLSPLGYKGSPLDRQGQVDWIERQISIEFAKGLRMDKARLEALQDVLDTLMPPAPAQPEQPAGAPQPPADKPQPTKARKPRRKPSKG